MPAWVRTDVPNRMCRTECVEVPVMLSRLLEAHELIIGEVRDGITATTANRDDGTNDLLMGDVLRRHELQVWFLAEHLVDTPTTRA